ncbi:hypothetical protein ASZ90_018627 [hydrocarbon metagenome]|uniref:Orotate phosphoribosyltransferase n=1 Tax=hydrocarbon metagenome TaxID=938273 RepID=A0A0W8E5S7_9ZZZZ
MNQTEQASRNWAIGCHLSALALYLGIPFGNILGPLIIWLFKKDESPLVDENGKEALNFQISLLLYGAIAVILIFVFSLTIIFIPLAVMLGMLIFLFGPVNLIFIIIAALKVSNGESFSYPLSMRLLK